MKCFNCGTEYDANSYMACPHCGAPHQPPVIQQSPTPIVIQEKRKGHGCLIAIAIFIGFQVVLGVLGSLIYAVSGSSSNEYTTTNDDNTIPYYQEDTTKETTTEDKTNVGSYNVKYISHRIVKDGTDDVLIVNLKFTNYSQSDISFEDAVYCQPFQDGIELKDVIFTYNITDYYDFNLAEKALKPNKSLEVQVAYYLDNRSSNVELELSSLFSFTPDDTITIKLK
jgi:hypothetical protein